MFQKRVNQVIEKMKTDRRLWHGYCYLMVAKKIQNQS